MQEVTAQEPTVTAKPPSNFSAPPTSTTPHVAGPTTPPLSRPSMKPQVPGSFPSLEGPALPISAEKDQLLKDLLRKYRADELTPEEYQSQRAKILAGP